MSDIVERLDRLVGNWMYPQEIRDARDEIRRLRACNAELLARLRGALHHVESEGDDTLAAMIRETITKAEGK